MLTDPIFEQRTSRLEKLRKRRVEFNFLDIDASELTVEVEQTSHLFPFGQAVDSDIIASCYDADQDDNYCSYARDNFNMITDTYRLAITRTNGFSDTDKIIQRTVGLITVDPQTCELN